MKILVTGATGFLGAHVVKRLLQDGHAVRVLRRKSSVTRLIDGLSLEAALGDITDRQAVFNAVQGCEVVFHLAGCVSFWKKMNGLQRRINVDGTRYVVEACLAHKVKRLVHTSSIAAIGFALGGKLGDETLSYNWWPYHINYCDTKHLAEEEVRRGVAQGLDAVMVNPSIVVGPGDMNLNGGALVFQMARRKVPAYPAGGCCVCSVEDVVEGHLLAWQKGRTGERYILGGDNYTWKELFKLIAEVLGVPPPKLPLPTPVFLAMAKTAELIANVTKKEPTLTPEIVWNSSKLCYFSSEKAKRELGYKVSSFRETVQRTYEWYRESGYLRRPLPSPAP